MGKAAEIADKVKAAKPTRKKKAVNAPDESAQGDLPLAKVIPLFPKK